MFLECLRDASTPFQSLDGSRVQGGQEREIRVEVVVLPQLVHYLDELVYQLLSVPRVVLLENFGSGIKGCYDANGGQGSPEVARTRGREDARSLTCTSSSYC